MKYRFTKSARPHTIPKIPSKQKMNEYTLQNSKFACKKLASYDDAKLCLYTV